MKNKILKTILAISITMNIGGYIHYEQSIEHKTSEISKLQDNVKTKSTKIAKLDSVIKVNNEKIMKQQQVIDNSYNRINELENKAKSLEEERNRILAENFKKEEERRNAEGRKLTVEATAYTANCSEGCTGRTKTGIDVSNTIYYNGYRVIAVDTSVIPLNSLVKVETSNQSFTAMAIDTGGAIDGHKIDVLVGNTREAYNFGRQTATLTVLKEGDNNVTN